MTFIDPLLVDQASNELRAKPSLPSTLTAALTDIGIVITISEMKHLLEHFLEVLRNLHKAIQLASGQVGI